MRVDALHRAAVPQATPGNEGKRTAAPLHLLQRKITTRLFHLGLESENRKFNPHLTLARLQRTPADKVGKYLENNGLFRCTPFIVNQFTLYFSLLDRSGAIHRPEQHYPLSAEPDNLHGA